MGQKTHPYGFRLGVIKTWTSKWYEDKRYQQWLHEDIRIKRAVKVPVIVSNRTSLPEIAGPGGLVFDPDHVDELEALLYNVLSDENLRRRLSVQGIARAAEFSWEKTAQKTLEAYDKALRS